MLPSLTVSETSCCGTQFVLSHFYVNTWKFEQSQLSESCIHHSAAPSHLWWERSCSDQSFVCRTQQADLPSPGEADVTEPLVPLTGKNNNRIG